MLYFMLGIMELELNLNVLLRFLMDVQEQLIMKAAREWVLSICKSIVMAHQGDVYARNYEDGAEFSFSLPMDEEELTEEEKL